MIKSDIQISEPAANLPPMQFRNDIETSFSVEENKIKTLTVEENDKLEVTNHFSRLKRRMRGSSSGIF